MSTYSLPGGGSWQAIAAGGSTGASFEMQVLTKDAPVQLMTATTGSPPSADEAGIVMTDTSPRRILTLQAGISMYARALKPDKTVTMVAMGGFTPSFRKGGTTPSTSTPAAAAFARSPLFAFGLLGAAA